MNRLILIGRLTRDPELSYGNSGTAICKFTIAVDNPFKRDDPKADFIPVTSFGKTAEACSNYLAKGRLCAVSGRWQTGSYERDGKRVYTNDCIADDVRFLDRGQQQESEQPQQERYGGGSGNRRNQDPFMDDGQPIDISDDDLPF